MRNLRSSKFIIGQIKEEHHRGSIQPKNTQNQNPSPSKNNPSICQLLAVILQAQDVKRTVEILSDMGLTVFQLPSTGTFLGQQEGILLVGLCEGQQDITLETIQQNCCQRQAYFTAPMDGAPLPAPVATPVSVGGAIIFAIDVEHFEEF